MVCFSITDLHRDNTSSLYRKQERWKEKEWRRGGKKQTEKEKNASQWKMDAQTHGQLWKTKAHIVSTFLFVLQLCRWLSEKLPSPPTLVSSNIIQSGKGRATGSGSGVVGIWDRMWQGGGPGVTHGADGWSQRSEVTVPDSVYRNGFTPLD